MLGQEDMTSLMADCIIDEMFSRSVLFVWNKVDWDDARRGQRFC